MPRILFVEDDADVRPIFEHILIDAGHKVDSTRTVAEGLELLASRDYAIVVADGRLPDGTGMQVADEALARGIRVIVITAYAFVLRELEAEPDKYNVLLKPIRPDELLVAIDKVLLAPHRL